MADSEIGDLHFLFGSVELQTEQGIALIPDGNRYAPVYFSQPAGGLSISALHRFDFTGWHYVGSNEENRKIRAVFHLKLIHYFRDWDSQPGDVSYYLGGESDPGILQALVKRYLDPEFWKGFSAVYIYEVERDEDGAIGEVTYEQDGTVHITTFVVNLLLNIIP